MMNFCLSVLAVFITCSEANPLIEPTMESGRSPSLRKFSTLGRMVYNQLNTTMSSADVSKRIVSYGCYCFRDGNSKEGASFGSGKPVDAQDQLCSNLMKCRRCLQMDYQGSCDVHMESYSATIDDSTNTITCDENQDSCRFDKCECDKAFAEDLAKVWKDEEFNYFYWGNNRNIRRRNKRNEEIFAGDEECKNNDEIKLKTDYCCGESGRRLPYSSDRHDCCDNNRLAGIGECL